MYLLPLPHTAGHCVFRESVYFNYSGTAADSDSRISSISSRNWLWSIIREEVNPPPWNRHFKGRRDRGDVGKRHPEEMFSPSERVDIIIHFGKLAARPVDVSHFTGRSSACRNQGNDDSSGHVGFSTAAHSAALSELYHQPTAWPGVTTEVFYSQRAESVFIRAVVFFFSFLSSVNFSAVCRSAQRPWSCLRKVVYHVKKNVNTPKTLANWTPEIIPGLWGTLPKSRQKTRRAKRI